MKIELSKINPAAIQNTNIRTVNKGSKEDEKQLVKALEKGQLALAAIELESGYFEFGICDAVIGIAGRENQTYRDLWAIFKRWPKYSGDVQYPICAEGDWECEWSIAGNPVAQYYFMRGLAYDHKVRPRTPEQEEFATAYRNLRRELWEFILEEVNKECTDTKQSTS